MQCPICASGKTKKVSTNFIGYVENTRYDIFSCLICSTQFIQRNVIDKGIYDIIYSQDETPGYDRYIQYAHKIKRVKHPLKWLVRQESTYYPIYHYFQSNKHSKRVLEVGCGYGYLSYALTKLGHDVTGIDISSSAINYAKNHFEGKFYVSSIEDFKESAIYDVIIATELIEHLQNPSDFISRCCKLLTDGGSIILTAPNKDYYPKSSVWVTDLPPVHTVWLGKKSIDYLSKRNNLEYVILDLFTIDSVNENKLVTYLVSRMRLGSTPNPVLDQEGSPYYIRLNQANSRLRKALKLVLYFKPIRWVSRIITGIFTSKDAKLAIVLSKK